MKIWKASIMLTAAVVALAGCASTDINEAGDEGVDGGTIRVAVNALPPGLGNPFTGIGAQSIYTWSALFDPLVMVDESGVPQPWLATGWENIDPNTWQFDVRDDVSFSDGDMLDAAAVKSTIDYLVSDEGRTSVVGAELKMIEGAEVVDDDTVKITTNTPDAGLPARLSAVYIVGPEAWAELGADGFATAPVGTGPFVIESIDANKATAVANTNSWRAPKADALEVTLLGDSAARLQALQSSQVDLAIALSPDQLDAIEAAGASPNPVPAPQVMALAFTQTIGDGNQPINDPLVRLALNHAVDRQAIADSVLGGLARPATQGATPETFGYNPDVTGYEYDPEKAVELLEEAGYADGLELTGTVTVGSFPGDSEIWQAVQGYLAEVGVTLTFETAQFAQWLEKYQQNSWTSDIFNQSWNVAPTSDAIRPAMIFSCKKANPFVCDEDIVPLIDAINSEFDVDSREKLLHELAVAFHENPPSLLLVEQVDINATADGVAGYEMVSRFIAYEKLTVQ